MRRKISWMDGRTEVKQYTPPPPSGSGGINITDNFVLSLTFSNYWWQESDIWSQASYRYAILWEAFLNPSDSYFLFAEERGYHKWALAHSSSCCSCYFNIIVYKNQQSRQTGSRNLMGPKTLPTIWGTYMSLVTKYQISAINSCWEKCDEICALDGPLPKWCPAVALSRQDGHHSAVALLLKAALIQVSDYRLLGASGYTHW
jgi:hypothetical protein